MCTKMAIIYVLSAVFVLLNNSNVLASDVPESSITIFYDVNFSEEAKIFEKEIRSKLSKNDESNIYLDFKPKFELSIPENSSGNALYIVDLNRQIAQDSWQSASISSMLMPIYEFGSMSAVLLQQSDHGRMALSTLAETNQLGFEFLNGGASFIASREAITKPDDLEGSKVGVLQENNGSGFWFNFGASAVPIEGADYYNVLSAGAVDTVEVFPSWVSTEQAAATVMPFSGYQITPGGRRRTAVIAANSDDWDSMHFLVRVPLAEAIRSAAASVNSKVASNELAVLGEISDLEVPSSYTEAMFDVWQRAQPKQNIDAIIKAREIVNTSSGSERQKTQLPIKQKISYLTNRGKTGSNSPKLFFGDSRLDDLYCGDVYADAYQEILIDSEVLEGEDECFRRISDSIEGSPVIIYIHGYRNLFFDAAKRALEIKEKSGEREVILWSWPSRGEVLDYGYDSKSVGKATLHRLLANSLSDSILTHEKISVLAHSLGSELLVNASHLLDGADGQDRFETMIFAAPDVSTQDFRRSLDVLATISPTINLYACERDRALWFSEKANGEPRIGHGGLGNRAAHAQLSLIEVSGEPFRWNHDYIFSDDRVNSDFRSILRGQYDAGSRGLIEYDGNLGKYFKLD